MYINIDVYQCFFLIKNNSECGLLKHELYFLTGLWQSLRCHNKTTSDFSFIGSSSLIATAGHSSESRNVCLWDMLLPPRSACVHCKYRYLKYETCSYRSCMMCLHHVFYLFTAFICHEHGCPAIVYAPHHQLLISGGRKGEVCIFDIRQRQLRHTFQAHDVPIRCLAMDPEEEYFVTGSSEGDIKVLFPYNKASQLLT